jgi:hypothetical protein
MKLRNSNKSQSARSNEYAPRLAASRKADDDADRPRRIRLRPRRERPRRHRTAEQRDELASFQLIEVHLIPANRGRIA